MTAQVDWFEIQDKIEQKLGLDHRRFRNVLGTFEHFNTWADSKGYTADKKDPEGHLRGSSQIWYTEYCEDPQGSAACPPYIDLWHCLMDHVVPSEMYNGSTVTMSLLAEEDFPVWDESDIKLTWRNKALVAYNEVMAGYVNKNGEARVRFEW